MTASHSSGKAPRSKPAKPYPEYPLTAHPAGQWCKKIRGRLHYFGPWEDSDGALDKYNREKDDLHAGRKPRESAEGTTVKRAVNEFLFSKEAKVGTGEITKRTWEEYKATCDEIISHFGKGRLVDDIGPDDFAELRAKLARRLGPVALGNAIQRVRSVFKFAADNGLIDRTVRYGQGFQRPSKKVLRLQRAKKGPQMFEAEEIRAMLASAGRSLKAMILLGVNCGFGNADCGTLPLAALDLDGGWISYHRPKTGIHRRCPLWPETAGALRAVLAKRRDPKDEAHAGLVFVTKQGGAWHKTGAIDNTLSKEMRKLLDKVGINGQRNFYALRHTFETVGGDAKDQPAVDLIMGHARDDMASVYRERISDERLKAVTDHVRGWLFSA